MERELRLGEAQLVSEITDAALAAAEGLDHPQAQGLGKGLEQGSGLIGLDGRTCNGPWIGHVMGNTS